MTPEEILARYDQLRSASRTMVDDVPSVLDRGEGIEVGRRLGILRRGTLVFDTDSELSVYADAMNFESWKYRENAVRRWLRASPSPRGSVEREVQEAWLNARFSIFRATRVVSGVGLYLTDVIRGGEETLVVDRGLALTGAGIVLSCRLVPFADFAMTTGAGLPIVDPSVLRRIETALAKRFESMSIEEIDEDPPGSRAELFYTVTQLMLASGQHRSVAYSDRPDLVQPDDLLGIENQLQPGASLVPEPTVPRVGRNEPCPCGSGRKYKRCHGA